MGNGRVREHLGRGMPCALRAGMPDAALVGLFIAMLGGTAVGLERQWSGHADGPAARFAGIRTFTMLGPWPG
jgi:hypothetical protein